MRGRRVIGIVAAALAAGSIASPESAARSLDALERRLNSLEHEITSGSRAAYSAQLRMVELSGQIAEEQGNLAEIDANLASTTERAIGTRAALEHARADVGVRARALYKRGGPLELFGVLLGAESVDDFVGRVSYARTVTDRDAGLLSAVGARSAELTRIEAYQRRLGSDRAATIRSLEVRRDAIAGVFAKQQTVLARLARARARALDLVERLGAKLGPGALASLRRVAGSGMTVTYGRWAEDFLRTIGAPRSPKNLVVMVAWEAAEGTQAAWNPLATTMDDEGATDFNAVGVKSYASEEQGIAATIRTLRVDGFGYEQILDGLERALDPMQTARRIRQSRWCHGCAEGGYVVGLVPAVERYYRSYAG